MLRKNNPVFALLLLFAGAGPAFADQWRYDNVRDKSFKCTESYQDNTATFCEYPRISICDDHFIGGDWKGCEKRFCGGFTENICSQTGMVPDPRNTQWSGDKVSKNSCWACKCGAGFLDLGGNCVSAAECRATAGFDVSSDGQRCETSKWCDDSIKFAYNTEIHEQYMSGSCARIRCKAGGCFESAGSYNCVANSEDGTFGGTHPGLNGVCVSCEKNQYVKGDGCETGAIATMAIMRNCFSCLISDEFEKCVRAGGVPTAGCNKVPTVLQLN